MPIDNDTRLPLPEQIVALLRGEYAEVLRGTDYDPNEHNRLNNFDGQAKAHLQLERDMKANAAQVTVLREAVRELYEALGTAEAGMKIMWMGVKMDSVSREHVAGKLKEHYEYLAAVKEVAAPLVNENVE